MQKPTEKPLKNGINRVYKSVHSHASIFTKWSGNKTEYRILTLYFRGHLVSTHGGYLESVVGAPVVNVVAETGDEEGQSLHVLQGGELVTILEENVAEVGYREGVAPVVVGRVSVALFYHQQKPAADVCIDQSGLDIELTIYCNIRNFESYC